MPTLEEQIAALNESLNSQQAPVLPTLPRGTPDDGTSPGLLGSIGSVLAGGQSPTYRLRGREADAAGGRALLNFGLNMLMASGPSRVRPDFLTAAATGLQGAQQSMDLDQRRAAAVAQQDYTQRMDLAKLGVEQNRDKIERLKAMLPLLQMQNRPVINADGSVSTAGAGGGGAGGGAGAAGAPGAIQFTGDKAKDEALIIQRESKGDPTALNYVATEDKTAYDRGATASGLYGFTNSTWRDGLQMIGGDAAKYPTARSAPAEVQKQVFNAVYDKRGTAPWDPSKWGQNWVKNAAGGYDLVKTGTGTGGTSTPPPPYKTASTTVTPPPTATTPAPAATPAVSGAPAATTDVTPPTAGVTPPTAATTPAPPTTGPLAGLPKIDDFVAQNMAKPTPEEEAMWRTPMSPEEEKNLRDGMKRLQSSVDAARASYNAAGSKDSESAYHGAQKAYSDAEAELAKRQREALKVGDDRKAKWYEGERGRLKEIYGKLVENAGAAELETLRSANKRQENVDTAVTGAASDRIKDMQARAGGAQRMLRNVQALEAFAPEMGDPNALVASNPRLRDWLITLNLPGLAGGTIGELRASQVWDRLVTSFAGDVRVPGSGSTSDKEGEWMMSQFGGPEQTAEDRMTQLAIIRKLAENRIADHTDAAEMFQSQNGKLSGLDKKIAERSKLFDRPPAWKPTEGDNTKTQGRYMMRHPRGEPYAAYTANGELRYYRNEVVNGRLEPRPLLGGSMVAE